MIAPSPHTTSFFDLQKPQVLLLMNLDLLECSLCNNWNNHRVLDVNLDLDSSICVYEGKHPSDLIKDSSHNLTKTLESFWVQNPKSTKEAHSYLSKSLLKTCLRFSLYTRRSRPKTLILNGLELLFGLNTNSADMILDRLSLFLDRSNQTISELFFLQLV